MERARALTIGEAHAALNPEPRPVTAADAAAWRPALTMDAVVLHVARAFGVRPVLVEQPRSSPNPLARRVAIFFCEQLLPHVRLEEIAERFRCSRFTVLGAARRIRDEVDREPALAARIAGLEDALRTAFEVAP